MTRNRATKEAASYERHTFRQMLASDEARCCRCNDIIGYRNYADDDLYCRSCHAEVTENPLHQRMLDELADIIDHRVKYANFLASDEFRALDDAERDRIIRQMNAMGAYEAALKERVDAWTPAE